MVNNRFIGGGENLSPTLLLEPDDLFQSLHQIGSNLLAPVSFNLNFSTCRRVYILIMFFAVLPELEAMFNGEFLKF